MMDYHRWATALPSSKIGFRWFSHLNGVGRHLKQVITWGYDFAGGD